MKYKKGQVVVINKNALSQHMDYVASKLDPPYVATITHIENDPHSGNDMYCFEECRDGWYENEVSGLYSEPNMNRFQMMDLTE